jgi:hypothetical protein
VNQLATMARPEFTGWRRPEFHGPCLASVGELGATMRSPARAGNARTLSPGMKQMALRRQLDAFSCKRSRRAVAFASQTSALIGNVVPAAVCSLLPCTVSHLVIPRRCGCSSMVEPLPSKQDMPVRSWSPAQELSRCATAPSVAPRSEPRHVLRRLRVAEHRRSRPSSDRKTVTGSCDDGSVRPNYDEAKFTELVLYVAEKLCDDRAGGATKLNKVLFFAEFTHVRRTGRAISGVEFQKLEHGPAPRRLRPVRDALVRSGSAEVVLDDVLGRPTHRLRPLRSADLSVFSVAELETIDEVLDDLNEMTARQVSDLSHDEPGWRLVELNETIPYEAALLGAPQVDTATRRQLEHDVAVRYGLLQA